MSDDWEYIVTNRRVTRRKRTSKSSGRSGGGSGGANEGRESDGNVRDNVRDRDRNEPTASGQNDPSDQDPEGVVGGDRKDGKGDD